MEPDAIIFVFWMLSFKPAFSLYSFPFIKSLFHSSFVSAIRLLSLQIWGYWCFSHQSWFQLVLHPSWHFAWCTLPIWRRQWHPTPVLLPGKSHGWRSLVGCSPWGRWGSDTTEQLHFHFSLPCIGEGNGNSLQCSCLENPRDGGAWWAAIYGVTQSRTWLKWLSNSNSNICESS